MTNVHLSIKDTTKYYKNFKAVDSVNLDVHNGEFITILGPSGSGKTTLLKLIAGFEELSDGVIYLNEQKISKKKAFERNIGMLFQNYALFPHMTVEQNIAYPLKVRKMKKVEIKKKVSEVLKLVHLEEFATRYPSQLSGGQQQRVALARAIVFNPPLLLLDEPLGALDKNLRKTMQLEIKHLQKKTGITTITVTHDQEEALTMSDRVCVMKDGRIEQVSTPTDIYNQPINEFVARFIGEINLLKGEMENSDGEVLIVNITEHPKVRFKVPYNSRIRDKHVYIAIRPENITVIQNGEQYENSVKVKVQELIFVGESLKVKTMTSYGQEIMLNVSTQLKEGMKEGDVITIGWKIRDSIVIPLENSD